MSVVADNASLKSVLGRSPQLSGIEVLFDDQADAPVSIDFQSQALEAGLKRILHGRNSVLRYSKDDNANLLLIGVMVLPAGEQDNARAKRLVTMDDEAYNRARSQLSTQQTQQLDVATERWQTRLGELPPERRAAMEKRVNERVLKQIKRDQLRAEKRQRIKQQIAKAREEEIKAPEEALEPLDSEKRADFERRSEAASEQVKQLLFNGQN